MLRAASYDIVFQEIPGEVTLALNISGCPNNCPGCHSPHLRAEAGEVLDEDSLGELLSRYGNSVTCVCFMGGDGDPEQVGRLASFVRTHSAGRLKTGWYSGRNELAAGVAPERFDYIKLGPYIEKLGGLDHPATNQRFYRTGNGTMEDITFVFRK